MTKSGNKVCTICGKSKAPSKMVKNTSVCLKCTERPNKWLNSKCR